MLTSILLGNKIGVKVRFRDPIADEFINPGSVIFTVEKRGEEDVPETLDSSGSPEKWYYANYLPETAGIYRVRATATDPPCKVVNTFRVVPDPFEEA